MDQVDIPLSRPGQQPRQHRRPGRRDEVVQRRAHAGALVGEAPFLVRNFTEHGMGVPPAGHLVEPGKKTAGVPLQDRAFVRMVQAESSFGEVRHSRRKAEAQPWCAG
jgi:hypothetical protein